MHRFILAVLVAVALLWLFSFAVKAEEAWSIDAMNEQIEKTNVIVGGTCSGTIINKSERLVLTAFHCITGQLIEEEVKTIDDKTGEITTKKVQRRKPLAILTRKVVNYEVVSSVEHLVKIAGADEANDIAILQVTDVDFVPAMAAKLAPDSYVFKRGLKVYAVGNPAVQFDNSITDGIISAPFRTVNWSGKDHKVFQHSASIIGGNSGGSVLNDRGELIGTVSAGLRGADIGFAIPISFTKDLLRRSGFGKLLEAK